MKFTISARRKPNDRAILPFLAKSFPAIPIIQIDSVFGFVERSTLYGGRVFDKPELTEHDVNQLYYVGIGVRLPLTNHYVEPAEYEATAPLFDKGGATNDGLVVSQMNLNRPGLQVCGRATAGASSFTAGVQCCRVPGR